MGSAKLVLVAGACVSVGALVGPALTTAAVKKVENVFVTNTAEQPIPIEAEQPIPIEVQGTPTVNVGTPTVAQAGTPVQFRALLRFTNQSSAFSDGYLVPAGKRLRVDHVTFHDLNREAKVDGVALLTRFGGRGFAQWIVTYPQGPEGDVASQPIVAYSDPGTRVLFSVNLDRRLGSSTSPRDMFPTFTGVLLDV